ncbi:MAG: DUF839 domain-containing protein, partial [Deltaproteobacteria bacterium]
AADATGGLAAGDKYMDDGKLYVAKFKADGTGEWVELAFGKNGITASAAGYAFADQADVLIHARLAVPGIDRRVIVEAMMTHSGNKKDRLFYDWQLPGVTLVTPDLSRFDTCWARENGQRNAILDGLAGADPQDVIMISDSDEVPTPDGVARAVQALTHHSAVVLCQRMFNYSRKWEDPRGWRGTVVTTLRHLLTTTPQHLRDQRETLPRIPDAGEHLSYFGGADEVSRKLASFAHSEYTALAGDKTVIRQRMEAGQDLFGRWSLQPAPA